MFQTFHYCRIPSQFTSISPKRRSLSQVLITSGPRQHCPEHRRFALTLTDVNDQRFDKLCLHFRHTLFTYYGHWTGIRVEPEAEKDGSKHGK